MKTWGWVAVLSILGSLANAESLGDLAKRERERREKKKQQGAESGAKVIHDDDLLAAPAKDSKGTFSPGTGFASGRGSPSTSGKSSVPLPAPTSSPSGNGGMTEVDVLRAGARQRLESSYQKIAETAWALGQAIRDYQACGVMMADRCQSLLVTVGNLAMAVGAGMEDAEEAARQGWLHPGEVRAVRQRYGMDDAFWDKLVSEVRQYRR
jgi:hypothetical protein